MGPSDSEYRPPLWRELWGSWTDDRGVQHARYGSPYYKLSDPLGAGFLWYTEAIAAAVLAWVAWREARRA